jgi:hypothetical protein
MPVTHRYLEGGLDPSTLLLRDDRRNTAERIVSATHCSKIRGNPPSSLSRGSLFQQVSCCGLGGHLEIVPSSYRQVVHVMGERHGISVVGPETAGCLPFRCR